MKSSQHSKQINTNGKDHTRDINITQMVGKQWVKSWYNNLKMTAHKCEMQMRTRFKTAKTLVFREQSYVKS